MISARPRWAPLARPSLLRRPGLGGLFAAIALGACSEAEPPPAGPAPLAPIAPPAGEAAPDPASAVLTLPPSSGLQCRDDHDCPAGPYAAHCLCTMPIPDGGVEAVGLCWNGRIKPRAWWCTVQDGHAFLHGVFVDE